MAEFDGWRRLACAILVRAYRDARAPNGHRTARKLGLPGGVSLAEDGRAFLESDGARWLVAALDLDGAGLDAALGISSGNCPSHKLLGEQGASGIVC